MKINRNLRLFFAVFALLLASCEIKAVTSNTYRPRQYRAVETFAEVPFLTPEQFQRAVEAVK